MNNMLAISVGIADPEGAVILQTTEDTDLRSGSRRVTRTKTLDGGCSIYDGGFSHADRTWNAIVFADEDTWLKVFNIMQLYSLVFVATGEGFFQACLESCTRQAATIRMSILIKEKIA